MTELAFFFSLRTADFDVREVARSNLKLSFQRWIPPALDNSTERRPGFCALLREPKIENRGIRQSPVSFQKCCCSVLALWIDVEFSSEASSEDNAYRTTYVQSVHRMVCQATTRKTEIGKRGQPIRPQETEYDGFFLEIAGQLAASQRHRQPRRQAAQVLSCESTLIQHPRKSMRRLPSFFV